MKPYTAPKRWAATLGLAAVLFLIAGFVVSYRRDRVATPDPRVSHMLYGWMVALHVLAVCCMVAAAAIILYVRFRSAPPYRSRAFVAVAVCLPVVLLSFMLLFYDGLARDARDYGAYQVLDVPDSEVDLVIQKYSYPYEWQVLGAHVYLEEDGTAGRYLGDVSMACVESMERGAYRIVNQGDGRVTIQWHRNHTYIWDEITFDGAPELP